MFRSSTISTLLIFVIFIAANEVSSAPREDIIPQKSTNSELVKTREAEISAERSKSLLRNERFDISKEDEVLHRRPVRVPPETLLASSNENEKKLSSPNKSMKVDKTIDNSRSNNETSEIKDMNESHVTPQDDDDNTKNGKKSLTNLTKDSNNLSNDTKNSLPPKVFPDDDSVQSISDASPALIDKLTKTSYTIDATNTTKSIGNRNELIPDTVDVVPIKTTPNVTIAEVMEISSTSLKSTMIFSPTAAPTEEKTTEPIPTSILTSKTATELIKITTVAPKTETDKTISISTTTKSLSTFTDDEIMTYATTTTRNPKTSSPSPAELLLHARKIPEPAQMPRGVVALITAISFTIVAVTIYIGLIVRRRFVEWRHGNRELLVNEFDATDISNFECFLSEKTFEKNKFHKAGPFLTSTSQAIDQSCNPSEREVDIITLRDVP